MKSLLILTVIFNFTLLSRENPFTPVQQNIRDIQHINTIKKDLQKAPILFETPKPKAIIQKVIKKQIVKPITKKKIEKVKKVQIKKTIKQKLIYSNKFAKIKLLGNSIKVITKDNLLDVTMHNNPKQLILDFERFDVVKKSSKSIHSKTIKYLTVGYHGYFYRFIFTLQRQKNYKITDTSYGYLITLR